MNSSFLRQIFWAKLHPFVGAVFLLFVALSSGVMITYSSHFLDLAVVEGWQSYPNRAGAVLGVSTPETVVWTNLKNVITEVGDLEQTAGGCQGCADAGANSTQQLTSGDGYFEFTIATGTYYYVYAGLSNDISGTTSHIMPFALEISASYVSVRENGVYKSDTPFVSGDVFRVSVESGKVKYYKNGVSFYTSVAVPSYPLVADVSMQLVGSKLWAGKIATSSDVVVSPPPAITPPPVTTPPPPTINTGAPVISAVSATNITSSAAVINWVTDISSDSVVNYGTSLKYGKTVQSSALVTNHRLSLGSLRAKTQYHFRVRSKANNQTATSGDFVFTTPSTTTVAVNNKPTGSIDGISSDGFVFGWAKDADDLNKAITVHLYFDTNAGSAGASAVSCTAGDFRTDVGNHAFNCPVPTQYRDGVQHQVWAWGVDLSDPVNNNAQLANSPKTFVLGTPPVTTAPTISSFLSNPTSITAGQSVTLSWSVAGATSLSIDQGIGDVTNITSKVVTPTATTTYTLTATNSAGSVSKSVTTVVSTAAPLSVSAPSSCVTTADGINPECPRILINSAVSATPSAGTTINVAAGGNLQNALNQACLGDTIVLAAGATFVGNFVVPVKTCGSGYLTIRTSNMSGITGEGGRVGPNYASAMPKIITPNTDYALLIANSATNIRLIGLEITSQTTYTYSLLRVGDNITSASLLPNNIFIDRSYIHGSASTTVRRCVQLSSAATAVIDSYISDCHEKGADSQAIGGWEGSGPYKIVNNYLEGAGENMLIGGSDPKVQNQTPSDIEVRGNYFYKQPSWQSSGAWTVKNLFELKNAKRVLVSGNVFENNWADGQSGVAILFTPRNQDQTAPWSTVEDITFVNNSIKNSVSGLNILGTDDLSPSQQSKRILVKNNLFYQMQSRLLQMVTVTLPALNVTIDHNTMIHSGSTGASAFLGDNVSVAQNFVYTNNVLSGGDLGFFGSGIGEGNAAISKYVVSPIFVKNVISGRNPNVYPTNNFFPGDLNSVGFTNQSVSDYSLSSSSPYKNAGSDGKDIGADFAILNYSSSCAISGGCGASSPPVQPPASLPVTTSFVATPSSIVVGQSSVLSWAGTGATSLSVSPGVGVVTGTSSVSVSPTVTTTYTLTATNSTGSVTTNAIVTVSAAPVTTATINIDATQRYQTMGGWEATAQAGALLESSTRTNTSNLDPNFSSYKNYLFDQAVNDLGINRLRIELPSGLENSVDYFNQYLNGQLTFNEWRAKFYDNVNDNTSATSVNASGFQFSYLDFQMDNYVLPIKQRLEARGEQLFLNVCFVDFGTSAFHQYNSPEEYAEFINEAYKHLQAKYGFVPKTLEIVLEPDNTSFNASLMAGVLQPTASRLVSSGFSPKFILPSTTSMASSNSYFDTIKSFVGAAFISQYVEELSYHRYTGVSISALAGIASRAIQSGVKTAMLEWIGADYNTLHEDLKVGNNSSWQQYALAFPGGFDDGSIYYSVSGTTVSLGSRTKYLRQYFKNIRSGAVRLSAASANSALDPVAFENTSGKKVVVVKSTSGSSFTVSGLQAGIYGVYYTVGGVITTPSDISLLSGQVLSASIPGAGVITIYQK